QSLKLNSTNYFDMLYQHCSPPWHYYKSICYYVFDNIKLDWSSSYRACKTIDSDLIYLHTAEMLDVLRDILVRERLEHATLWTNTTWGHRLINNKRSMMLSRYCRKIETVHDSETGILRTFRLPFSNCREKHTVICRKYVPPLRSMNDTKLVCKPPWAFVHGICYYLEETGLSVKYTLLLEEVHTLFCQNWTNGQLFFMNPNEKKTIILPFLSNIQILESQNTLQENFGGVRYTFENIRTDPCIHLPGDVYFSSMFTEFKNLTRKTPYSFTTCPFDHLEKSYTLCRQKHHIQGCEPPWFVDDGFCLYYQAKTYDMGTALSLCKQNGGHVLYVTNEHELYRLVKVLSHLQPFYKKAALSGAWLALYLKVIGDNNDNAWSWDMLIEQYLDSTWKNKLWQQYFQNHTAAGDCSSLVIDRKIAEPIERVQCDKERTLICRKTIGYSDKQFHRRENYVNMKKLIDDHLKQNDGFTRSNRSRISQNKNTTTRIEYITNITSYFYAINSTTFRLIIYSDNINLHEVSAYCNEKFLFNKTLADFEKKNGYWTYDVNITYPLGYSRENDYKILSSYFRLLFIIFEQYFSPNCTFNTTHTSLNLLEQLRLCRLNITNDDSFSYNNEKFEFEYCPNQAHISFLDEITTNEDLTVRQIQTRLLNRIRKKLNNNEDSNDRHESIVCIPILNNDNTPNSSLIQKYFEFETCNILEEIFTNYTIKRDMSIVELKTIVDENISIDQLTFPLTCMNSGGQCIPKHLLASKSTMFIVNFPCPLGYLCWIQGEECSKNSYCIDRFHHPCLKFVQNFTCLNARHHCCSFEISQSSSLLPSIVVHDSSVSENINPWNILLPLYYFSFHGTSKWDIFFFNEWLKLGSDISHDLSDEFLFKCYGIFIEKRWLLTHEKCSPTRINSARSIIFSMINNEKVALHVIDIHTYSPFRFVRLATTPDPIQNITFKRLNLFINNIDDTLLFESCVLVIPRMNTVQRYIEQDNDDKYVNNDIYQIRFVSKFERQVLADKFDDNNSTLKWYFYFNSQTITEDMEGINWLFSPISCVVNYDWKIVAISGSQLKHTCMRINGYIYCQMFLIQNFAPALIIQHF
ncbi:unnamed protein product, partial [Didymodactylos carnosus]